MRYSNKVRDKAILILSVCASTSCGFMQAKSELGFTWSSSAYRLASAAWDFVEDATPNRNNHEVCAEAKALLQTGWSP